MRRCVLTTAYQARLLDEINAQFRAEGDQLTTEIERVERQLTTVEKRLANLLDPVELEGRTTGLVARLAKRERERVTLSASFTHLHERAQCGRPVPVTGAALRQVLDELREALTARW